jgi:hypothetical protein
MVGWSIMLCTSINISVNMVIVLINGVKKLYLILRLFIWKFKLKRRKAKK